jgi:chemotaxis protein CheC
MSAANTDLSEKFITYLKILADEGINHAAEGFSGLLGCSLTVADTEVKTVDIARIPQLLGGPENEAVGIYLRAEGDIPVQIMLIIPYEKALKLVDLMMGEPEGSTQVLGKLERSGLAEIGNMTGTFFMNTVARMANISLRPTPPAVMVDMLGAILDIIIATTGGISDKVLLMQAKFEIGERKMAADFWVIPDQKTLEALEKRL